MAKREMHPNSMANLRPMEKGDPSRNPRGMTPEVMKRIQENAEKSTKMQDLLLRAQIKLAEKLESEGRWEDLAQLLRADMNTLARDTQDRAWGKAQGSLDLTSSDETMKPTTIRLIAATAEDGTGSAD